MEIPEDNEEIAQHESHLTEDVEAGIEIELQERETEMDIEVEQEETLGSPQLAPAPEADTDHYLGKNGMEWSKVQPPSRRASMADIVRRYDSHKHNSCLS